MRWLLNWWKARKARRNRLLFEFFDGSEIRAVDPWLAYRILYGHPEFDMAEQLAAAVRGEEPETTKAKSAICAAFGCRPFDADKMIGLTDEEMFGVLNSFLEFCSALEKKTSGLATSSPNAELTL